MMTNSLFQREIIYKNYIYQIDGGSHLWAFARA